MTTKLSNHIQQVADPQTQRALYAVLNAVQDDLALLRSHLSSDGIIIAATLSKGSTPENVATTGFGYVIDGLPLYKAAVAAGTAPAAATINTAGATGIFYGGFALQINAAGTISTLPATGDQVYATAAEAYAYALTITPTAGNVIAGYFVVGSKADTKWTGGTDDLDGDGSSDSSSVVYYSVASTIPTLTLTE
jgi:hypothetical protein